MPSVSLQNDQPIRRLIWAVEHQDQQLSISADAERYSSRKTNASQNNSIRHLFVTISLDPSWLSSDNLPSMAAISQTRESHATIRVALVIEFGKPKPVWFEQTDKRTSDRIFIKEICSVWTHREGSAKIMNFAVTAEGNNYQLSLNTEVFT